MFGWPDRGRDIHGCRSFSGLKNRRFLRADARVTVDVGHSDIEEDELIDCRMACQLPNRAFCIGVIVTRWCQWLILMVDAKSTRSYAL